MVALACPAMFSRLKRIAKHALAPIFYLTASREHGLEEELAYWDKFLRGRLADYDHKVDPFARVTAYHRTLLDMVPRRVSPIRVLDVGSGPLTAFGKVYDRPLEIVPLDPLADQFAGLLRKHGISPLVPTVKGEAESLVPQFGPASFDLVVACNSLDHGRDPFLAIQQMIAVTKPGGVLALQHVENVATHEAWRGLHQWNFTLEGGDFLIRGRHTAVNVTREVASRIRLTTKLAPGDDDSYSLVEVVGVRL